MKFGTDGVRGLANKELTARLAFELGQAGALVLAKKTKRPRILIAQDTRLSSDMLVAALTAGLCSVGADVINLGVLPTPAIAALVKEYNAAAGVMMSASHNPFYDNGIKFFDGNGYKLPDEVEGEIVEQMKQLDNLDLPSGEDVGRMLPANDALPCYVDFLKNCLGNINIKGLTFALDCAHGATYKAAPRVFVEMGAKLHLMGDAPDGVNINEGCGSTHMEALAEFVKGNDGVNAGFAFDGDGDRCLAVDEMGNVVDGDMIMSIIATHMLEKGQLAHNTLVATVMSNLGLFKAAESHGFNVEQTKVGDRYVLERMKEGGFVLGGEQSGHIIQLSHQTTGDGILAALTLAGIMAETGKTLSQLNKVMVKMPQTLKNAKIPNDVKDKVLSDPAVLAEINLAHSKFEGRGRVLIRPSGTEPLVRVMIEGENLAEIEGEAVRLAELLEKAASCG
ncbi:MAG: phosphoglucosamine mutase [Defluviitaleaceae bacterium]|nr:phosphoglucosamine mutase [Defluviitaleaceae bacterium]